MSDLRLTDRSRLVLLLGSPLLVALTIFTAPILGRHLGSLPAVLALLLLYWCGCWALSICGAPRRELAALYRTSFNRNLLELILTWLPPLATFGAVFLAAAPRLPALALLAIIGVALVNGVTEETFWRGAFVAVFPGSFGLAYMYPAGLFAVWHVALFLLPGVRYEGGASALIGGAVVMGLGWGWVAWRTHDLRSITAAHVLTNVFAFSGAVVMNWVGR